MQTSRRSLTAESTCSLTSRPKDIRYPSLKLHYFAHCALNFSLTITCRKIERQIFRNHDFPRPPSINQKRKSDNDRKVKKTKEVKRLKYLTSLCTTFLLHILRQLEALQTSKIKVYIYLRKEIQCFKGKYLGMTIKSIKFDRSVIDIG